MGAGWIAQGADSPAPAAGATTATPGAAIAPTDPWKPTAPDTASVPSLVRPHQAEHPVDGSIGLFQKVKDAIGGTADDPSTPLGAVVDWGKNRALAPGPSMATLASAYPHLVGTQFGKLKAGLEEGTGAAQTQSAERQLAAVNVLPQVAARYTPPGGLPDYDKMAEDPLVKKTAISLGISPGTFAHDYNTLAGQSNEALADTAARAKQMFDAGQQNKTAGQQDRAQAWADERVWQPSDLTNGKLDPMSLKGLAFNTALAIPSLAAVAGAAAVGTAATGNPAGGIAAGGATAVALFAPQQRADIKDKIDDQVNALMQKADALDDAAPIGGKRGLNPITQGLRQQAADLNASSDKIANTAGFLYAVSDAVGAVPVSAVLSKSPAGKAMLDRMVGAATQKYVGGRIAGAMVANGAGGMLQATIQKAVDTGIVHEQTSLSDALKDIAYTGITSALTAAPIAAAHEAAGAPGRAQAKRDLDSDELLSRVKAASARMGTANGETNETYPGYKWNEDTHRYDYTGPGAPPNAPRLGGPPGATAPGEGPGAGPGGPPGGAGGGGAAPGTEAPTGAAGARAAYQAKTDALNAAAAAAEKRSDVSLQPEEEGWSVHVKGQPVATFDTAEAAREAMAQARKVVGTKPAAAATNAAPAETEGPIGATKAPEGETAGVSTPVDTGLKPGNNRVPEDELERTQPVQPERRSQGEMRTRVDQMTPEQMKAALLTHELTGIPNRRAYEDAPKKAAQVSVDVDSLKWLNDNAGHDSGDQMLKAVAQAMHEESGGNAYHLSGDEFALQGDSHEEAEAAMARVRSRLAEAKLTFAHPDGRTITLSGIGVSHGTGPTLEAADRNLGQAKSGREERGLRAARGEQPPNARIAAGQSGLSAGGGATAAGGTEVLGQKVKPPQKPTVGQADAGNYFKPTVHWNGLPIKVENVKGQRRRYLDAKTGKPGQRVMKADYGYFPGTKGNDEDGIDVMMGPHHEAPNAYVIDQLDHSGKTFDEHKIQLGVRSEAEAREQYLSHYPVGWKGLGAITELDPAQLKRWLKEGDLTKPVSPDAVPVGKVARGAAPNNRHDSVLQYLARHPRGLDSEEAETQGIDKADMALAAAHVGIKRAFRKGGMTFDEAAEHLHESGYRVANRQGHYDPNVLLDKISDELRGRPHLDSIDRVGPPVRTGDVTSSDFIKDFGFRGLEFGNWAASDERQKLLNHAYEGMHDLARVLNLPPRALSLNGTMGLALGARGGGRFAAHYESGKMVINMTKINGAGALAHEWGHALDHYMGEYGRADAYTTGPRGATGWRTDRRNLANLRPEMQAAWEGVMAAMYKKRITAAETIRDQELALERYQGQRRQLQEEIAAQPGNTNLPARLGFLDRSIAATEGLLSEARSNPEGNFGSRSTKYVREAAGLGDYWRRPTEMFARAFEGFVEDKIHAEGGKSEYLVHHAAGLGYPAEDRPAINAAIQHLVDTLETREENGKSVLYRRGDGTVSRAMSASEVQDAAHKFLAGFNLKPDLVIVKDLAELQNGTDRDLAFHMAGYEPGDVTAFLKPSTRQIYLIADQFHSPADVAATLAHEYVGHFGLRAAFGDKGYQAILDGVNAAMPAEVRIRGQSEYGDSYNHFNPDQRARAAEETLAYYSQRYTNDQSIPAQIKRWVEKFLGAIRDWIRKAIGLPQKFDELFVKRTLADLESYLRRSGPGRADHGTESEPAFAGKQDTFFSGLATAVDAAKRDKGTGAEWEATLKNMPGVKAEEMQWTGLKDWLEGRGRVSKQEVADYVAAHRVQLGEVEKGGKGQELLDDGQIAELNDRMAAAGYTDLEPEQVAALERGGHDTDHMLEELHRMGIDVKDMLTPAAHEGIINQIRELGYSVEEGVHGDPELEEIPRHEEEPELTDAQNQANYDRAKALLEDLKGGPIEPPKYTEHATPGGQNYRELLMTMPKSGDTTQATRAKDDAMELRVRAQEKVSDATRAFLAKVTTPNQQVIRANVASWLYDATNDSDKELAYAAIRRLNAAVARQPYEEQDEARKAMDEGLRTNRVLRKALDDEIAAIHAAKHAEGYVSPHWGERNVLAHIRFDDRAGPNGEKILHINEVQSDWHQAGRRVGYRQKGEPDEAQKLQAARLRATAALTAEDNLGFDSSSQALNAILSHADWMDRWGDIEAGSVQALEEYRRLRLMADARATNPQGWAVAETRSPAGRVPDAPFKTTWPELAMKRMLRYAAEHGYDKLSWDTGSTNADRYNMQAVVDHISVQADGPGRYTMRAYKGENTVKESSSLSAENLRDLIGKDMAQKAVSDAESGKVSTSFKGDDLKVGGAGMRGFYDDILPKTVQKLVKKWGSSVEPATIGRPSDLSPEEQEELARLHDTLIRQQTPEQVAREAELMPRRGEHQRPVHMVAITPALRDSVMGGQPMFLKRRKGSTGSAPAAPKKGAYDLARRAVAAIPNNEFALSLRRIADPAGVSEPARATALVTREALGELARNSEEALQNLEHYAKQFDLLGTQDRYDFIDSMETGSKQKNTELQPAADAIRKILDDWRERIRGLGVGALDNFIENYFPHIWANDAKAKKIFGQIFGRRPLKGPASFLKERTIPTTKEGLEAGLTPISTNPLVLAFAKLREMQRFYTGVKLMQRFKDEGLAKFLPASKLRPDDWAEINDAVGRVRQWSEAEQGFIERGKYIMPVDAARVINNHLGVSALRNFLPAQIFRVLSNAANALQLGFSGFHLGFTTFDVIISKNALGLEQLLHGQAFKAARTLLEANAGLAAAALAGPIPGVIGAVATAGMNIRRGHQLLKAYGNIGGATPQMRRIVEGLEAAGGRVKMDNYYMAARGLSPFKGVGFASLAGDVKAALTQPRGKVMALTQTLTSFPQQYAMRLWRDLEQVWELEPLKILPIMSALEVTGRVVRASTSIIMEHIVPMQKLGVFSDLASDHIQRNPLEDPVAFAASMQKIWNTVDDRLGEMVYDNLFWNRTFKEVNHMLVRAVGWNLGTVRVLGGAPIDVIKLLDYMARGAPAELAAPPLGKTAQARLDYERQKSTLHRIAEKVGHKIPYTLALVATTMLVGAIFTRLFTGKDPKDTKDYFFPPTGRTTKYGTPERISMPSYTKDLYEYGTQPGTTILNKANPIFGIIGSIIKNEDFFGNGIRNTDDSAGQQIWQSLLYGARQVMPFSVQGTKQFVGGGDLDEKGKVLATMPYVGFTPAPARVTSPEQMDAYQHEEDEKRYIKGLRMRIKQAREKDDKQALGELTEELRNAMVKARETEAKIRSNKMKAAQAQQKISSLVGGKSRTEAVAALHQAGLPAMARLWESLPEHPRPRVAESLEAFA